MEWMETLKKITVIYLVVALVQLTLEAWSQEEFTAFSLMETKRIQTLNWMIISV
jgi:hypothetical protein